MHPSADPQQFYSYGGAYLRDKMVDGRRQYFIAMYDVYHGNANPDRTGGVPLDITQVQRLRVEVYYDPENSNRPTIRGFIKAVNGTWKSIGKRVLMDLEERRWPIEGDITWVGAYVSKEIGEKGGYELIAGDPVVLKK